MTLNGVIALILRYFTEFDNFESRVQRLRHSGWSNYNVCRISSSTFGHDWPTQQSHGLSAIAELLVDSSFRDAILYWFRDQAPQNLLVEL